MLKFIITFLMLISCLKAEDESIESRQIVIATKRIVLEDFPDAWNPSILKTNDGLLLTFRYLPDRDHQPWLSYIGAVLLNDEFDPISKPELLNTRLKNSKTPSQSEDARVFLHQDRMFLIYNDNIDIIYPATWQRRDMFMSELFYKNGHFTLTAPLKLVHDEKYPNQMWQKNWVPFEKDGALLLAYSIHPHEILYANLNTGKCYPSYTTTPSLNWQFGTLRGSTPPLLIDGEYLAFFHSGMYTASPSSWGLEMWHYFMGAYTFSAEPPFQITKITPLPIMSDDFYTPSGYYKRVIFPGGFVATDTKIYVAYGKDDCEMWIATLDRDILKKVMIPVMEGN